TWMYATSPDSLYVNQFAGTMVNIEDVAGTAVQMVQETNYPWDGKVAITVNPAQSRTFAIRIRVPNRSVSELYSSSPDSDGLVSLAVNGAAQSPQMDKGYAVITREWKAGDKIEIELPMKPQRVKDADKM